MLNFLHNDAIFFMLTTRFIFGPTIVMNHFNRRAFPDWLRYVVDIKIQHHHPQSFLSPSSFQVLFLFSHGVVVYLEVLHHLGQTDFRRAVIVFSASFDLPIQFLFVHENVDALEKEGMTRET